jgi:hypothetical protein
LIVDEERGTTKNEQLQKKTASENHKETPKKQKKLLLESGHTLLSKNSKGKEEN